MTRREKRLLRTAAINFALVIGAVIGIAFLVISLQPEDYDPTTLCIISEDIPPHTAVMLDKTDEYSRGQADRIAALIRRAKDRLEVGERFTLFELDARGRFDQDGAFSLCNPGRGKQINPLYRNPRFVEEQYQTLFERPLEDVLDTLVAPKEAPSSPIAEALMRLGNTEAFSDDAPERRVIVVSDMLQNSAVFTAYGGRGALPANIPDARDTADELSGKFGDSLRGVEVEVYLIPRGRLEDLQRGALREYWEDIFRDLGADLRWRDL